jgi:hypothetical protein
MDESQSYQQAVQTKSSSIMEQFSTELERLDHTLEALEARLLPVRRLGPDKELAEPSELPTHPIHGVLLSFRGRIDRLGLIVSQIEI